MKIFLKLKNKRAENRALSSEIALLHIPPETTVVSKSMSKMTFTTFHHFFKVRHHHI